jgi:hypothetical protein
MLSGVRQIKKPMSALEDQRGHKSGSSAGLQRSWVAERLPQITVYLGLRREIQLLEQFRRDRDAAGGPNSPEGSLGIMTGVEVLMVAIAVWACLHVNAGRIRVRGFALTVAEVLLQGSTQVWRGCSEIVVIVRPIHQIVVVVAHTISINWGPGEVFIV